MRARSDRRDVVGLLLFDKPLGLSSNQALQRVRRLFAAAKAGHTGSLDPLASGMLPILFGSFTRLAGYLLDARKTYRVTALFGIATDTGDAEGRITDRRVGPELDAASIERALSRFHGEIEQIPPMYSALKHAGVPLYRLARRGEEVERAARRVTIEELVLENLAWPSATLRVRCSKGTYIRTLVEDLAAALDTVAHVIGLRRLSIEPFEAGVMHSWESLEAAAATGMAALDGLLLGVDAILPDWQEVHLEAVAATRLAQGQKLPADPSAPAGPVKIYGPDRGFLAIGRVTEDGWLLGERVFQR